MQYRGAGASAVIYFATATDLNHKILIKITLAKGYEFAIEEKSVNIQERKP